MSEQQNCNDKDKKDLSAEKIVKSAEVKADPDASDAKTCEADAVLDRAAKEAKKAENFEHGDNDAGATK